MHRKYLDKWHRAEFNSGERVLPLGARERAISGKIFNDLTQEDLPIWQMESLNMTLELVEPHRHISTMNEFKRFRNPASKHPQSQISSLAGMQMWYHHYGIPQLLQDCCRVSKQDRSTCRNMITTHLGPFTDKDLRPWAQRIGFGNDQ